MNVAYLDDEIIALEYMKLLVNKVPEIANFYTFSFPQDLYEFLNDNQVDIVLLDIEMYDENGIDVAAIIKKNNPKVRIIFVTAHDNYALSAFKVHAQGYLLKPVTAKQLSDEINSLGFEEESIMDIRVQTFGNFEIFYKGVPLKFKRSKSKELLAYLVDKRGTPVTTSELIVNLWEDKDVDKTSRSMFSNLICDIEATLEEHKILGLLIKNRNSYQINKEIIDCDYFNFLMGDLAAINLFTGEYMSNYDWAMFRTGYLEEKKNEVKN